MNSLELMTLAGINWSGSIHNDDITEDMEACLNQLSKFGMVKQHEECVIITTKGSSAIESLLKAADLEILK